MGTRDDHVTARHNLASAGGSRRARRSWARPERRLRLVDVENLVGTGQPRHDDLAWCQRTYRGLDLAGPDDLVVIASSPYSTLEVGAAWPSCRLRIAHGESGADRALVRTLLEEAVERRFDQFVIASGDGIFIDPVVWLQQQDVQVAVVARPSSLSTRLRLAATRWIPFPPMPSATDTPASAAA